MDYKRLKTYLDANAATFGALSDADAATEMNVVDKTFNVPSMSGKQIKEAFAGEGSEWMAIGAEGRNEVLLLATRDDLDPHGVDELFFIQAVTLGTNQAPNATAALNAARTLTRSRADIEGFGAVLESHINVARAQ